MTDTTAGISERPESGNGAVTSGESGATAPEPGPDASVEGGEAPGAPDAPEAPEPAEPLPTDAEPLPTDEERLALYLRAERAILLGHQSYGIEGITCTRADLGRVQAMIASLRARIAARRASASGAGWGGILTVGVRF